MKDLNYRAVKQIFKEYLTGNGYKKDTIRSKLYTLKDFFKYLNKRKLFDLKDVGENEIENYVKYLDDYMSERTQKFLGRRTKVEKIGDIRLLFKCLYSYEYILKNPFSNLNINISGKDGERKIFSSDEIGEILNNIDISRELGLRDRTIFELIYSSGLRVSEVANLKVSDLDMDKKLLLIRQGKFSKDRIVPVSEVALMFIRNYLGERIKDKDEHIFLSGQGGGNISGSCIGRRFRDYLKKMDKYKKGLSTHSIRHSIATHLLGNGAKLKDIKEILGHSSLESTIIYTKLEVENLKKVYKSYHPRENEYYEDVEDGYREKIVEFKKILEKQAKIRERYRGYKENYYLKKKTEKSLTKSEYI